MLVILTGATGLVGSSVLHHILSLTPAAASAKHITRLSILSRKPDIALLSHAQRPTENTHTQINVITHADFNNYSESLLSSLKSPVDSTSPSSEAWNPDQKVAVIWALGMSQNDAKSPKQYIEVTKTYALNAAKAFAKAFHPSQVNFVYVSGEGATSSPGMFTPLFGKVKGETEQELIALTKSPEYQNLRVYNVRPGGVDPGTKVDGQPAVDDLWQQRLNAGQGGLGQRIGKAVMMPVLRAGIGKSMHSPTDELSRVLLNLGIGDGKALTGVGVEDGGWTLRNLGVRRLGKEMS